MQYVSLYLRSTDGSVWWKRCLPLVMQIACSGEGTALHSSSHWYTGLEDAELPLCQEGPLLYGLVIWASSETQNVVCLLMSPSPLSFALKHKSKVCPFRGHIYPFLMRSGLKSGAFSFLEWDWPLVYWVASTVEDVSTARVITRPCGT